MSGAAWQAVAHLPTGTVALPQAALPGPFAQPFFLNALLAGTAIAAACGLTGYFLVLRSQVFTADALSHVAFTGAMIALAFGADLRLGLFAATAGVAMLLGLLGPRGRPDDVVIGSVFSWVLGIGVLFLALFTTGRATGNAAAGVTVLFGSIFGISSAAAALAAGIGAAVCVVVLAIARPLMFATVDGAVAAARGVPVRLLGIIFLVLVGASTAEATQAIGAMLLLGLLAAPAATARRLTARPFQALALSALLAIGTLWAGLLLSYAVPAVPPSFAVIAVATALYGGVGLWFAARRTGGQRWRARRDRPGSGHPGVGVGRRLAAAAQAMRRSDY